MAKGCVKWNRMDTIREDAMYERSPVAISDSAEAWCAIVEEEGNGGKAGQAGKIE